MRAAPRPAAARPAFAAPRPARVVPAYQTDEGSLVISGLLAGNLEIDALPGSD